MRPRVSGSADLGQLVKILALDQSSHVTGYSIFENGEITKYGNFSAQDNDLGVRLEYIRSRVAKLIADNSIDKVILEDIQLQNNVTNNVVTFKTLAEVFGVLYELCTELKIPCDAVLAGTWKSALGVKGRTRPQQKAAAADYVLSTFGIRPDQDTCDAICIGAYYCGEDLIPSIPENQDYNWG